MNKKKRLRKESCTSKSSITLHISLLVFILLFFGIVMAWYINMSSEKKLASTLETSANKIAEQSYETEVKRIESKMLNSFKNDFIDIMKQEYPSLDLSFLVKNLDTGVSVVHNNKLMNSASIIKLFILETVYSEFEQGRYNLTPDREKDLEKMITQSDNPASNNFIDDFGGTNEQRKIDENNAINQRIKKRGYKYTELNRKMHDVLPPGGSTGYNNYTSVGDVCKFLEDIYNKALFEEPYNTRTIDLLKNQQRRAKIPAKIVKEYSDIVVANKTGELAQVENDAALIMCEDFNLVFIVLTDNIPKKADGSTDYALKEKVQSSIADAALKLVEAYKKV